MSDELTELHPDKALQIAIKNGDITQAQVDQIWAATWDMPAQTPLPVRRAIATMREVTKGKDPQEALALAFPMFMQFMMTAATETQAAMTKDESRFSHLVAGTECIVKTLQNINPLEARLERLEAGLEMINDKLTTLLEGKGGDASVSDQFAGAPDTSGEVEPESASPEAIPDPEQEAQEARRKTIGSAWAK